MFKNSSSILIFNLLKEFNLKKKLWQKTSFSSTNECGNNDENILIMKSIPFFTLCLIFDYV